MTFNFIYDEAFKLRFRIYLYIIDMSSNESVEFISNITKKLNSYFAEICNKNYHFECATESRKLAQDFKTKQLKKAYRLFKKLNISNIQEQIPEKEKEKIYLKNWQKLTEEEKLKYLEAPKSAEKKPKKKKQQEIYKPQNQ